MAGDGAGATGTGSGSASGKQQRRQRVGGNISETLDEVEVDLKKEEDTLLKVKELIMKEIRVLKV